MGFDCIIVHAKSNSVFEIDGLHRSYLLTRRQLTSKTIDGGAMDRSIESKPKAQPLAMSCCYFFLMVDRRDASWHLVVVCEVLRFSESGINIMRLSNSGAI